MSLMMNIGLLSVRDPMKGLDTVGIHSEELKEIMKNCVGTYLDVRLSYYIGTH